MEEKNPSKKIKSAVYNITDFGACVCDRLQTEYIQNAIDTCFLNGGGRVNIPKGIFHTGGIRLRSGVELHLESGAVLEGSFDPEDYTGYKNDRVEPINAPDDLNNTSPSVYPFSRWNNAIIRAINAKNIAITGDVGSYINGVNCYDPQGEENYRGPHAINIQHCENVILDGYTVANSANWAHAIFITNNITARNLTVYGGHDGFDVRTCDNVLVENCEFYTGDDCIAGFDNHDVIIRNCIFDSACSALRFGGNNVVVENCRSVAPSKFGFRGSLSLEKKAASAPADETCRHNMHTPFMYYCDFRANIRKTPGNIVVRDCEFENPDSLFLLQFDGRHKWCTNRSLASITFENCRITNVCEPAIIHGDANEPISFKLENVTVSVRKGFGDIPFIEATNYEKITLLNVTLEGYNSPTLISKTKGKVEYDCCTQFEIKSE